MSLALNSFCITSGDNMHRGIGNYCAATDSILTVVMRGGFTAAAGACRKLSNSTMTLFQIFTHFLYLLIVVSQSIHLYLPVVYT